MSKFSEFSQKVKDVYSQDVSKVYDSIFDFITNLPAESYTETLTFELILFREGCAFKGRGTEMIILENKSKSYCSTVMSAVMSQLEENSEGMIDVIDNCGTFTIKLKPLIP